jgi:hypothetical protein
MKLPVDFLQLPIAFDAPRLAAEIAALGEGVWRPHPSGLAGNDALPIVSTHGDPTNDAMAGPMRPTPHLSAMPYLMQVMEAIGAVWGRSRLMRLSGHAEVSPHIDTNYYWTTHMRVHVPVVTQPTVRFHVGERHINMAEGECWVFDTWQLHKVINDAERARIHLVIDTVGGEGIFELMRRGRRPGQDIPAWTPKLVPFDPARRPALEFETVNAPVVMTPYEMAHHIAFLLGQTPAGPRTEAVREVLDQLQATWRGLWARFGSSEEGRPRYRQARDRAWGRLQPVLGGLLLDNGLPLARCLMDMVFLMALDDHMRQSPAAAA